MTSSLSAQITFNVDGNWTYRVGNTLEAGSDFSATYTSNAAQVYLTTTKSKAKGNFQWKISIHKEDVNWDNSLRLYAQRTGAGIGTNGNGQGLIQGGTVFQEITNFPQSFFTGKKGRGDIPIQYQMEGVSLLIPADTYTTNIIFTLTEE